MRHKDVFLYNAVDLEGTGVDLEGLHQGAFEEVASNHGVVFGPEEFHGFVGRGDQAISEAIAGMLGSTVDATVLREEKNGLYRARLDTEPITPRDGFPEYLEEVRSSGGELVLASITPDSDAMTILTRSDLLQFFAPGRILTETSVKKKKPDPAVYNLAAARLGISREPHRMLVHEDSPPGVASGSRAGAKVAAFPVHEGLVFIPQPDAKFTTWKGVTPQLVFDKVMSTGR